jgi:hypothetical protein
MYAHGLSWLGEASIKFTARPCRSWLLVFLLACPLWALAGDVHYNQMDIKRDGRDKLVFSMSLNLTHLMHQVLAPQTPLVDFLKFHSELPDKALQTAIDKAGTQLGDKSFMLLPSGSKVSIRQWQFPPLQALRETLKAHLFLLDMPTTTPVHVPPMWVQAIGHSKSPWSRAQLQVHKALHPVWVIHQQDQFWLTEQIPLAIVNFE